MPTVQLSEQETKDLAKKAGGKALELGKKGLATGKQALNEVHKAGMFELKNFKEYNSSLVHMINMVKGEVTSVQGGQRTAQDAVVSALTFKSNDPEGGFKFMNALALWMEVLGSLLSLLFGAPGSTVVFQIIGSYLIAYVLYFLCTLSNQSLLMGWGIFLYVLYALANLGNLISIANILLVLPAVFHAVKVLACGYCAFYGYQMREKIAGAQQIP